MLAKVKGYVGEHNPSGDGKQMAVRLPITANGPKGIKTVCVMFI
jgi:hypothetical protein